LVFAAAKRMQRALAMLARQPGAARLTGGAHAAAWADGRWQRCVLVREDVGRHNALDKLIGALAREGVAPGSGFVAVTSRASYEMVQKVAAFGAGLLVAVSAPTSFAVRMAHQANITLVGFARAGRLTFYTHH
jgi:FdhD protein